MQANNLACKNILDASHGTTKDYWVSDKKIIVDDVTDMWFYVCIALIVPKSHGDKEEPGLEGWMPCVWWVDVTAEVLHA